MITNVKETPVVANDSIIDSYGFAEQLSSNENFFQELLLIATRICESKSAYISLVGSTKQFILSQYNSNLLVLPVEETICKNTVKEDKLLEIPDTSLDCRTAHLSIVKKESIKFYAGVPLKNSDKVNIGSLCIIDENPKQLNEMQKDTLSLLAKHAINTLDNQRNLISLIKEINSSFKPAACADAFCLQGELQHLQKEVVEQKDILDTANKKLTSFAHIVAHDIKAPIRTINSFIQLIERDLKPELSSTHKEFFTLIKSAASNITNLTDDLLTFSESRNETLKKVEISFQKIMTNIFVNLQGFLLTIGGKINYPKDEFIINGNESQMIQLFQNFISNGLKYQNGSKIPIVTIDCKEVEKGLVFSINDNGLGIDASYMNKIFEPFQRLHSKGEFEGSGIGLATCMNILENHESHITVDSEKGKGTTFTFLLPGTSV